MLLGVLGTGLERETLEQGEFNPSLPLIDARFPSSFVVESSFLTARSPLCKPRPCRGLARGGACLRA